MNATLADGPTTPGPPPSGSGGDGTVPVQRAWSHLTWWQVILVLLVPAALGATIDQFISGEPGAWFAGGFVAGSVLAALLAGRGAALFVAAVQPPLAFVAFGGAFSLLLRDGNGGQGALTAAVVDTALWLTTWFPVMAAATIPAVVIAAVRGMYLRRQLPPGEGPNSGRTVPATRQSAERESLTGTSGTD